MYFALCSACLISNPSLRSSFRSQSPTFLPSICDQILSQSRSLNEDGQLYEGHVNLCLQVGSTVGVVVRVSDGGLKGQVLTSDAISVTSALLRAGAVVKKIVDRVTIATHAMYLPKSRKNDEVRHNDGNLGNFLWMYGATRMANPFTTLMYHDDVLTGDIEENAASVSGYLLASANAFMLDKYEKSIEYISIVRQRVVQLDVPTVIIGIGIQAEFKDVEDVSKIALFDFHADFLNEVVARQRSPSIAVRGDFTETACKNVHVNNCISMGCPSLTISHDLNLGRIMKTRWDATMEKIQKGERLQKLIITLPALQPAENPEKYDSLVSMFLHLYQNHEVYFIEQMGYDRSNFVNYKKRSTKIVKPEDWKRFDNVEDWIDFVSDADLIVSTRIHGGMAGIATGTPTFVIPTDFRIMELVNAMAIPYLSMEKATLPFESLSKTVSLVEKDFDLFERNRRIKIYEYVRILGEIGVEIDPALLEVLNAPL
ncbi:hypothetical protein TL16_g11792 [Triparma laevis f. inornata]|uniref:Polysaccharide pyruvyl transferase domain-containing protein n=1 Tax=Triparma laevis f. inornata TaxID=1714386 RepID=A0A9W7ETX4_9STRA|nr:hypothetical protein TL16_g11792 [Triparma laevis f. inornata]